MAYFSLSYAMDTAETLLNAIGIPGEIIVDHEMSALEIYAFSGCICGNKDLAIFILFKGFFCLFPILSSHTPVDVDDGIRMA
jgi:hypothetical protein